jgi:hypothetical protein
MDSLDHRATAIDTIWRFAATARRAQPVDTFMRHVGFRCIVQERNVS